jgi:hypothetical protein
LLSAAGWFRSDEAVDILFVRARINLTIALFCDGGSGTTTAALSRKTLAWLKKRKYRNGRKDKAYGRLAERFNEYRL